MKKIYIIGIGGIGISGIARYYNENGYKVFGSDKTNSELIEKLKSEGIDIVIGSRSEYLGTFLEKVVYTEAVPETDLELKKARELGIKTKTYPEALAEIANKKKLIAISGTHGKSTTTSMTSIMLKDSNFGVNALVGTLLKEFDSKNTYFSDSEYFALEACEYKRSFLRYKPFIGVITNIEIDHLDYYKDLNDYISAFESFAKNIVTSGYLVIDGTEENSRKLVGIRDDINYVLVFKEYFSIIPATSYDIPTSSCVIPANAGISYEEKLNKITQNSKDIYTNPSDLIDSLTSKEGQKHYFPTLNMQVPGEHILYDAKLAFTIGKIVGIEDREIKKSLEQYTGVWRRSEIVGITKNENILMSDYGHHPTEIKTTLKALKEKYLNKKLLIIFQPHQYNRTLELLEGFKTSFSDADILVTPDIYYSRDSKADMEAINGEKFINVINHTNKIFGDGLDNTLNLIKKFDKENPGELLILLLGAGNVDDLRYQIDLQ